MITVNWIMLQSSTDSIYHISKMAMTKVCLIFILSMAEQDIIQWEKIIVYARLPPLAVTFTCLFTEQNRPWYWHNICQADMCDYFQTIVIFRVLGNLDCSQLYSYNNHMYKKIRSEIYQYTYVECWSNGFVKTIRLYKAIDFTQMQ